MAKTFFLILRQLVVPAGESEAKLPARAAHRLGVPPEDILSCRPLRRSLDARKRRGKAVSVYHLRLELPNRWRRHLRKQKRPDIVFETDAGLPAPDPEPPRRPERPLVVGAGPAGLFAALRLARAGWKPLVVERGDDLDRRRRAVADFWRNGVLDPESNVLYGMGGAGLFSDGKLNTRHKDREGMRNILGLLVAAGAPESVLVDAQPHVGTDILSDAVANLARFVTEAGGEIRFRTRLAELGAEAGALRTAVLEGGDGRRETVDVAACVLATGHSARDVYETLVRGGFRLEPKPFAVGLRVEMPQDGIDASQRTGGGGAGEAASFRLSLAPEGALGPCYTFCMCPGGQVIACASEPGRLAVNGMSFHARAGEWGNAAFLTPVAPEACLPFLPDGAPPELAGIFFQRAWEEKAYRAGLAGGAYCLPASRLEDYAANRTGTLPERRGVGRAAPANLRDLLPADIGESLARGIPALAARLRRVNPLDITLYGIETRTSSPVRVARGALGEALGCAGLYPAGEGSGYAGGIMTSALDGWNAAGALMRERAGRRNGL